MLLYLLLALRKRSDLRTCPWIMNDVSILIVTNELFPHYFLLLYRIILTMKKILSRQAYMTKYNAKTKHKYVRKCQRISRSETLFKLNFQEVINRIQTSNVGCVVPNEDCFENNVPIVTGENDDL